MMNRTVRPTREDPCECHFMRQCLLKSFIEAIDLLSIWIDGSPEWLDSTSPLGRHGKLSEVWGIWISWPRLVLWYTQVLYCPPPHTHTLENVFCTYHDCIFHIAKSQCMFGVKSFFFHLSSITSALAWLISTNGQSSSPKVKLTKSVNFFYFGSLSAWSDEIYQLS